VKKLRKMRNPNRWYGKRMPRNLVWEHLWRLIDVCDNCRRFCPPTDLHSLLWPECEADMRLQEVLGVEEALSYCPGCLAELEAEADKIDLVWRKRQFLA